MKIFYIILSLCLLVTTAIEAQDSEYDPFTIQFFTRPHFKKEIGIISGSVAKGESAGARRGNMSVASFKADSFLQVTLYTQIDFGGKKYTYTGSKDNIKPPVQVRSVKWKHL
ncbi:hypothetical protein BD770DRAFT_440425 [Pilaira anomala]|nr:hypothetical protein BD770DRAFT_440425 [Pilaira anomala]